MRDPKDNKTLLTYKLKSPFSSTPGAGSYNHYPSHHTTPYFHVPSLEGSKERRDFAEHIYLKESKLPETGCLNQTKLVNFKPSLLHAIQQGWDS